MQRPWRKWCATRRNRCFYPAPEPLQRTPCFWFATGLVTLAVLIFCVYFISLFLSRQAAYQTSAEDLGIIDQALWNTVHGRPLHETICDIVTDSNCVTPTGVMRFSIHFEPLLFPIALLYVIWPAPQTLLILQVVVVSLGAFPAYWLARLRLRNEFAGVAVAVLYLLYPAQQQALGFDFHAVTLAASLLLFTLYFLYTRRVVATFFCAVLAMACKEEIPIVIALFGLWSVLLQRRWSSGFLLILLALAWFVLAFYVVMPHFSPTGKPLLLSRYATLGTPLHFAVFVLRHPLTFVRQYITEPLHAKYLMLLFLPVCYLALLAPWVMVLAIPSIALNLLSSDPNMYSGSYQYNAEIVPIIIFATIEAIVIISWLGQLAVRGAVYLYQKLPGDRFLLRMPCSRWVYQISYYCILLVVLAFILNNTVQNDYAFNGQMPFASGFQWPVTTAHTALAQHFIQMIPPDASVSAQTKLVPHLSHRQHIYLFPYEDDRADYIFLDVTGDVFPYYEPQYISEVRRVLLDGQYGVLAAQDGYLLLKHGLAGPGVSPFSAVQPGPGVDPGLILPELPSDFCSYIYGASSEVEHPLQAEFVDPAGGTVSLVGYTIQATNPFRLSEQSVALTTYWRVSALPASPLQLQFFVQGADGTLRTIGTFFPQFNWCQSNTWTPGAIIRITSVPADLHSTGVSEGLAHLSIALLPLVPPSGTIGSVQERLSCHIVHATGAISMDESTRVLQLMSLSIVE